MGLKIMEDNLKKIKAAIAGGSGYTGLELLKLLFGHPHVKVVITTSNTYSGIAVCEAFPSFYMKNEAGCEEKEQLYFTSYSGLGEESFKEIDIIFLCLPATESMEFVKKYLNSFKGVIIDIGSDFRIKEPENYRLWYGKEHVLKELLKNFVYGLPEINEDKIRSSKYIANPGCYPTSVLLALAPVISNSMFDVCDINADSKSGVSGAGRKLKNEYLFYSLNDNFYAYSPTMHRHIGEIEQELEALSGKETRICFTPHLLPIDRGIFTSVYCRVYLKNHKSLKIQGTALKNAVYFKELKEKINIAFADFYKNSLYVRFLGEKIPQVKDVAGTNMCHIGYSLDERTGYLKIFSVLDNLMKGAAGQAVQNMNLVFGYEQKEGLY